MKTSGHLDWLAVTFPADLESGFWLPAKLLASEFTVENKGPHGYTKTAVNDIGVIVLSEGAARQGTHVVYTGEPLGVAREMGVTDRELVMHAVEYAGRFTRLDVAVNILDGTLKPADLEHAYMHDGCDTSARAAGRVQTLNTDRDTLYIGSRASERMLRAYNKGAQLGTGEAWIRLELECKKLMAQAVASAIADNANTRAVINRAILEFVDFPYLPEWSKALRESDACIPPPTRKMHSTYRWLLEVVAPALARYQFEHPEDDIESVFTALWRRYYAELRKRGQGPTPTG
jgi:hypothetical protein